MKINVIEIFNITNESEIAIIKKIEELVRQLTKVVDGVDEITLKMHNDWDTKTVQKTLAKINETLIVDDKCVLVKAGYKYMIDDFRGIGITLNIKLAKFPKDCPTSLLAKILKKAISENNNEMINAIMKELEGRD